MLFRFPTAFRLVTCLLFLLAGGALPALPVDESESDETEVCGEGSDPETTSCVLLWRVDRRAWTASSSWAAALELEAWLLLFSPPLGHVIVQPTP